MRRLLLLLAAVACHVASGLVLHAVARGVKLPVAGRQAVTMGAALNGGDGPSNLTRRRRRKENNGQSKVGGTQAKQSPKQQQNQAKQQQEAAARKAERQAKHQQQQANRTVNVQTRVQEAIYKLRDEQQRIRWRQGEDASSKAQRKRRNQEIEEFWPNYSAEHGLLDYDIEDCENDMDLVMRAAKELEWALDRDFGTNGTQGLGAKIRVARTANEESLPTKLAEGMQRIAGVRNTLAHERDVRALPDRQRFVQDWREVVADLSIERARASTAKQMAGFKIVLPRQPGDDFIRTELEDGPVKRWMQGTGNATEFFSWLFGMDTTQ